jgi:hypothetical protein
MDTKIKGDIAEQAVILFALQKQWGVAKPIGDRLPYDVIFDVNGKLAKIQVKYAWYDNVKSNFVVDVRRTKTNRRNMVRMPYTVKDFDFAVVYIEDLRVFYVFPSEVFIGYGSEIHFVETDKRQRKPKSFGFRNAWELIEQWAA